jgi:hypothetical protein
MTTTKKDDTATTTTTTTTTTASKPTEASSKETAAPPPKKKMLSRNDMPSVAYMLKHGNPETAHLPKSKMEIYGYPVILAVIFAISLLIFHHAPHDKSAVKRFKLPQNGMSQEDYKKLLQQEGQQQHVKIPEDTAPEGEL